MPRASKACLECRARKIRCDVIGKGSPCTNCSRDQKDCVVGESSRVKYARTGCTTNPYLPGGSQTGMSHSMAEAAHDDSQELESNTRDQDSLLASISSYLIPDSQITLPEHGGDFPPETWERFQGPADNASSKTGEALLFNQIDPHHPSTNPRNTRPAYIKKLPAQVQDADLQLLHANGALEVPHDSLRNDLIKGYMLYIHPYMPVLDLESFLQAVYHQGNSRPISLCLFQAVMFAGAAFSSMEDLHAAGFLTKRDARKAFYERAKMLYFAGSDTDDLSLVQALLLLSLWSACVDDPQGPKYWLSACLSAARRIGLNQDPKTHCTDLTTQRLYKRIWWSIYVREKQIAIGFRQQARITDDECDVPLIEPADLECNCVSAQVIYTLDGLGGIYDPGNKERLASLFIEQVKLSICIGDILAVQYAPDAPPIGGNDKPTLLPKRTAINEKEVRRCDQLLQRWFNNIPDDIRYKPTHSYTLTDGDRIVYLHGAVLTLMYLATSSALHRPVITSTGLKSSTDLISLSHSRVCQAGTEIATVCKDLYDWGLTRYLSTTATTFLLPAMTTLIMEMKCKSHEGRMINIHRLCQCRQILLQLQDIYPLAEEAINLVNLAAKEAGVQIPTNQASGPF